MNNKVTIHNKYNNKDYTFIVTNDINDIPNSYEVWNCSIAGSTQIPMVHTTNFNVDTDREMYLLETDELTTKLIMQASMRLGLGKHKEVKEQLDIINRKELV